MIDMNSQGEYKGYPEKTGNMFVARFRSKANWPIRRLFSYMTKRGVMLDNLLPFDCFREAAIQRYIAFEDRRLSLLKLRRKKASSRMSKKQF
ncbi:MAG: hypothetical protein MK132_11165 [Lentisphaerales bacterium]|nr:hypothetical protein [Lentisphaerales bacterium]